MLIVVLSLVGLLITSLSSFFFNLIVCLVPVLLLIYFFHPFGQTMIPLNTNIPEAYAIGSSEEQVKLFLALQNLMKTIFYVFAQ